MYIYIYICICVCVNVYKCVGGGVIQILSRCRSCSPLTKRLRAGQRLHPYTTRHVNIAMRKSRRREARRAWTSLWRCLPSGRAAPLT